MASAFENMRSDQLYAAQFEGVAKQVSKSVKDCRLSKNAKLHIRVPNRVGITGGAVDGAMCEYESVVRGRKVTIYPKRIRKNAIKPNYRGAYYV